MALSPDRPAFGWRWLRALASRRSRRWVQALLAATVLAAAVDAWQLLRQQHWNASIEAAEAAEPAAGAVEPAASAAAAASAIAMAPGEADADAPLELQFAQAHALAAAGLTDAALNRYGRLVGPSALGQAARFNSANLLLRQGIALRAGEQPGQALALIELAKEGYRELLRHDAEHWPARYNLERAQRLLPDPEELEEEAAAPPRSAERAATTMRGDSPGLP